MIKKMIKKITGGGTEKSFLDDFFGILEGYEIDTLFVDRQDCVDGLHTNVDKDKVYIEYRYKWDSHMLIFYHIHHLKDYNFFIKLGDAQFDKKMKLCKEDLTNYAENFIKNLKKL